MGSRILVYRFQTFENSRLEPFTELKVSAVSTHFQTSKDLTAFRRTLELCNKIAKSTFRNSPGKPF